MHLLILGAGGHGKVVKEIAYATMQYSRIVFLDDCLDGSNPEVIGKLDDYEKFKSEFTYAFVAIGNPDARKEWQKKLWDVNYDIPVLVHPKAYLSPSAYIGVGTVVMPKAVVQANVRIGKGCIVSAGAIIDHNCEVGDYCHINAGAVVAAGSKVPSGMKVDYNVVFKDSVDSPVADAELQEQHKKDFGREVSFF